MEQARQIIKHLLNETLEGKDLGREDIHPRRFYFDRSDDIHNTSGTGVVFEGVLFTDGTVAVRWLTDTASTSFYNSIEELEKIHSHEGRGKVVFIDEE
jgi:hypothetical protein